MNHRLGVFLAALVIAVCASGAVHWLGEVSVGADLLLLGLIFFLLSAIVIYVFVRVYLSEKLLPVYRTLFGASAKSKKIDLLSDPLAEAEKEVSNWAGQRREEIKELQQKDDYRKEFIGNLAHELKTPLFNIQGYISSLLEGAMDDELVKEKFLEKANRNVDRMARIVEDLDTISHLEFDRLELDNTKMDIVQLAQEVLESFEIKAAKREVSLTIKNKESLYVVADEFRISQVLSNLISNAISYGKHGGLVEIECTDLTDLILIEVLDDGLGIDPQQLPRIFERFYRVDKSRSRDVGGSGLGLAIVKHILEGHGQTIRVKSIVDEGSRFSFTLPKAK